MSYILDALKKAETERALGSIPGLHAQVAANPLPAPGFGRRRGYRTLVLPLAIAFMLALLALAWYRQPAPVIAAASPPLPAAAPNPAPMPTTVIAPASVATPKPVATPAPMTSPPAAVVTRAASHTGIAKAPKSVAAAEPLQLKKAASAASVPPTDERLLTLRELPEQIQQEIPALTIGGYIYSDNRAERSLLINNKLLREGDEVAAGLRLEKMMPTAAVLNYKGYRYRITY
jgi:general secretion pathway protein B